MSALGDFDPKATFDAVSRDYEDAGRDYWHYLSPRTVERLALRPGERVLDVPCGTAPSVLAAARAVGPTGHVDGVDYAEQMLAIAREKVCAAGLDNVTLAVGDMTSLSADEPYDAVICVLGLFFVDDMPAVARSFHDLLRPGGRLGVTVFGEQFLDPMREVFVDVVNDVVPGLDVVQPWSRLITEDALRGVFEEAGIGDVRIETDDDTFPLPSAERWWQIVMGSSFRRPVTAMGDEAAAEVRARCDAYIAENGVRELFTRTRYAIA